MKAGRALVLALLVTFIPACKPAHKPDSEEAAAPREPKTGYGQAVAKSKEIGKELEERDKEVAREAEELFKE